MSLNQFIAAAVAENVGVLRTAAEFLREQAGDARPEDLLRYVRAAPKVPPVPGMNLAEEAPARDINRAVVRIHAKDSPQVTGIMAGC